MKNKIKYIALLAMTVLISSCTSSVRFSFDNSTNNHQKNKFGSSSSVSSGTNKLNVKFKSGEVFSGKASYYANDFDGRQTASGTVYDKNKLTAAHRELPFGTKIRVRNLNNNRTVVVLVNDRGPFRDDRVLDLSAAAAEELDMINDGVVDIEFEILDN
jgi:rare lipoprotein A